MIAIPYLVIVVSIGYVRQATALAFIILAIINITAIIIEKNIDVRTKYLSLRNLSKDPPKDLKGIFDSTEYTKSQEYTKTKTIMGFVTGILLLSITLCFWFLGGFNSLDVLVRKLEFGPLATGLISVSYTHLTLQTSDLV